MSASRLPVVVLAGTPLMAEGLAALLDHTTDIEVVGISVTVVGLTDLLVQTAARVVVTDMMNTPWGDGTAVFSCVAEASALIGVTIRTVCVIPSSASVASYLRRAGAAAVLTYSDAPDVLHDLVTETRSGDAEQSPPTGRLTGTCNPEAEFGLTARELDILQAIVDGFSSKAIADKLGLSVNTVRTHVQRLLPKLGVHNRLRASAVAVDTGLVNPTVRRLGGLVPERA